MAVTDVADIGEGHILVGDGAVYYEVTFNAIAYKPEQQEIIEGSVVEIVNFGAFVAVGPVDCLVHVSQIADEFMTYDEKSARLTSRETNRSLNEGDHVRAKIVTVSLNEHDPRESKIGLTMRQPALGSSSGSRKTSRRRAARAEKAEAKA